MDLLKYLNIKTTRADKNEVILELTIKDEHKQPYGYLHGGMNGVLIETACSIGANMQLEPPHFAVGVDMQVNHLAPAKSGLLKVIAVPDRIGKRIQVWQASIYLNDETKIAVGRCTLSVSI
ncbi:MULTISPECIES: PaaI family thioesterase [unclassified Enterococcus]|jgi:1,4-dihydroxy-2-naphthoyl-CoA hydrolase|uniref:PaaI family thioesterase n=1 Tax=unclassified Enterococcus TaxID=2608891 RepID=UPI003D2696FD